MTSIQEELMKRRDFLKRLLDGYQIKVKKESQIGGNGLIEGVGQEKKTYGKQGKQGKQAEGKQVEGKQAIKLGESVGVVLKGSIRAIKHGKGYQYYIKGLGDNKYRYVKAENKDIVRKTVQMEYDAKVREMAENEYKRILGLLNLYERPIENIYESMPIGKQMLVNPVILPDDEYIRMWKEQTYETLGFRDNSPEFYSSKGERMRSKSEVIIANLLDKLQINYKYEKPLKLRHIGIVHPDFTILDVRNRKDIYLEHLGMLDDQAYRNNAIMKIRDYENSGYFIGDRLIVTGETGGCPLDIKSVERKIRFVLGLI